GEIDRRHADISQPKDDPFIGGCARGLPDAILGGAKRGRDRAGRQIGKRGIATQPSGALDLQPLTCGLVRELAALLELLNQLRRFGLEAAGDLVVAPSRLDLVLDLIKLAFTRGRDAEDVVPDIASFERNRIVVDAAIAVKRL